MYGDVGFDKGITTLIIRCKVLKEFFKMNYKNECQNEQ
jgi:hypothetical protein